MKITGTKKLWIILFALVCALTVGLGVTLSRSAKIGGDGGTVYAQVDLPAADGDEIADAAEEAPSPDEEEISATENQEEAPADGEEVADAADEAAEEVEKVYDPRFDEGAIAEIAARTELDADFINLYCHVRNIDANELLTAIVDAQEDLRTNSKEDSGCIIIEPGEEPAEIPEEEENVLDKIYGDMADLMVEYGKGVLQVDEEEDYYVAPDEVSSYVNYRYTGVNSSSYLGNNVDNFYRTSDAGASWTQIWPTLTPYCDASLSPNWMSWSWTTSSGGVDYIYNHYGLRAVIELAPGEMLQVNHWQSSNGYNCQQWYVGSTHWAYLLGYDWVGNSTSYYRVDGDAPSGTQMIFYTNMGNHWSHTGTWNGNSVFFTWADYGYNYGVLDSNHSYAYRAAKYRATVLVIKRSEVVKPELVDDGSGGVNVAAGTKSVFFEGEPVTISMSHDVGASIIDYAFYKDSGCTVPDDGVTLSNRSEHGKEGIGGKNITFRSSVAGKHYIRLRLIQPSSSPYLSSTAMQWTDGTNGPLTFMLEIKLQTTPRPTIVYDAGVASNGKSKTVNYTGEEQKITFTNADKSLISWSSNGLIEDSWDEASKTLVLKQTERGTYQINLYITNTAGCVWADNGQTDTIQIMFYIKEMLIDRTYNLANASEYTLHEGYTGAAHILDVGPAVDGQLIVIAPGVGFTYETRASDGMSYLKFTATESGTQEIMISPAKGYIWKDTKDQSVVKFTIIIDAVTIPFPTLLIEDGCSYSTDEKTKNLVFNPEAGWKGTLVIQGIPKQAIGVTTAMEVLSWEPSAAWTAAHPTDTPLDIDRTVLTLGATNANTYPVNIAIVDPNFTWEVPTNPPVFNLFIDRFELYAPLIAGDTRPEFGGAVELNPEATKPEYASFVEPDFTTVYSDGQLKMEGYTKQVYYNNNPDRGDCTPDNEKYFRLYAGGFTSNNQVTIDISKAGLTFNWVYAADGLPFLELKGTDAGNYIINITPTPNYRWIDKTTDMKTFKFNIIPIFRDSLEMFVQKDADGNSWEPIETFNATVTYDGEQHKFRIGDENNPSQFYDSSEMIVSLVDQAYNVISPASYPEGFTLNEITSSGVKILEGTAVHAGVYLIRLQLKNENYSWRQGSGIDMYYTFNVAAKALKNPILLKDECSGGAGQNVKVEDTDDVHSVYGGYNGNEFMMVIGFEFGGMDPSELDLDYNPSGIDFDPETSEPALWGSFGNIDETGMTRLVVKAKIVGSHKLLIELKNSDYKWAATGKYYEFSLIIDFAEVDFVTFSYGDPDTATFIGKGDSTYTADYDSDPEKLHNITITRSDSDFDTTPFESMFTYEVTYNKPAYEIKSATYNDTNLVLGFQDANSYYINIYLTSNYRWKKQLMRPIGDPVRMVLTVNPKTVSIPMIIDEGEKDEIGNPIASVNNGTLTKTVTYDSNTLQSIMLNLGDDFRAFEVDTVTTTSFLNVDNNVTPLKDKKLRYTAKSAGTYLLVIVLSDTNNYVWSASNAVTYTLEIRPRAISAPTAFFVHNKDINDQHTDYPLIMAGAPVSEPVVENTSNGRFETIHAYTGELQYMYLFGYAVENSEVDISVTPSNPANADGLGHLDVSVGGEVKGHFVYAKYVNVYTITVEFKLSAEFGTPNCHWQSISMGTDTLPREFFLEIEKMKVKLPELAADPSQAWAPDNYSNQSLKQTFTYDGAATGPSIIIDNCLDEKPIGYMFYSYNKDNSTLDFLGSKQTKFSIDKTARVDTEYQLKISLDTENECWDSGVPDDIDDRFIYIVIEKKGITRPTIAVESDGATYTADSKTFTYNGSSWPAAMKIDGYDSKWMGYSVALTADKMSAGIISGQIVVDVLAKDSGTYTLQVTLEDPINLKWDGTTDDSSPAEFSVIIAPKQYTRPELDGPNCVFDTSIATNGLVDAENLTTTYLKGLIQQIVIKNYIDDSAIMTVDVSTGKAFDNRVAVNAHGTGTLTYGAEGADDYLVVIKPSLNATWDSGAAGDITFTLKINPREYVSPAYDTSDDVAPPLTSLYSTSVFTNDTKTVTYVLSTKQAILFNNFDDSVMQVVYKSVGGYSLEDICSTVASNQRKYQALNADTYEVTFKIKDDLSNNNCFDDALKSTELKFRFIIEKQKLALPVFDADGALLQTGETVNAAGDTFAFDYDGARHANILLNVLDGNYMTYKAAAEYNNNTTLTSDKYFLFETAPNAATIAAGSSLDGIYRPTTGTHAGIDMKPSLTASPLVSAVDKKNYIRVDAVETGTYQLIFNLKETVNFVWADGTTGGKTVTFKINIVEVAAPQYNNPSLISQPYTGEPIKFEIKSVFGATGDGLRYTTDGVTFSPTPPAYTYEVVAAKPSDSGVEKIITLDSLNTTTNVLTVTATEIGTYVVTVSIKESEWNQSHVKWAGTTSHTLNFVFTITKRPLTPEITFGESANATLNTALATPPYSWPQDETVKAIVKFPDVSLTKNVSGNDVLDLDFDFEIYYVNTAIPGTKINAKVPLVDLRADIAADTSLSLTTVGTHTYGDFVLDIVSTVGGLEYNVYYKYVIKAQGETGEKIPQGNYRVHVDGSTSTASKSYTFVNKQENFTVEALKAPFVQELIELELYKLRAPTTVIRRYTLADIFPTDNTKVWSNMTATEAIKLPFLETDDSYGFRVVLSDAANPSCYAGLDGMQGEPTKYPIGTYSPASTVLEALNRWEVKWMTNGTYAGKPIARYAGSYNFSITIAALDALKYSYPTTTLTFYYEIEPVLYDLKDLDWNYVTGTTVYTYDGTAKSVEMVGTFPEGLSVGSYVVSGYDSNSQISAKVGSPLTDPLTNYHTTFVFANSNPNYVTPVAGDPTTYKDTAVRASGAFPWEIVWSIEKASITDLWNNELNNEGSASAYIPKLTTHGSKVDYTYYIDVGGGVFNEVTSFEHTGTATFKVVASLKTSTDPALDYANNYDLTVTNSDMGTTDTLTFVLGPGSGVSVDVVIRMGDPEQSTLTAGDPSPLPLPANNVFVYDGTAFSATLTNFTVAGASTISLSNVILTYYNASNKFRPISAPNEPGHYLIKLQLTGLPNDGNDYSLQDTEYYFDIEKGTFNTSDLYWRYTHTDANGFYTEAKYDDGTGRWLIVRDSNSTWDGTQWVGATVGMVTTFVYDGADHKVELYSSNPELIVNMKREFSKIAANADGENYEAVASFSFNGKYWNDPVVATTREWRIEKATVDLTAMYWDYPAAGYVYTRVQGEEKGFNVIMKDVPNLIANYVSYEFFKEEEVEPRVFSYEPIEGTVLSLFTKAGKYKTVFTIDEAFANENTNYKLGPNPLADLTKNPDGLISWLDWTIEVRNIAVPDVTGIWTDFDGLEHNLLTAFDIQNDWEEYYEIKIYYKPVKDSADAFESHPYEELGISEFGSEYSAMHAGYYKMAFHIKNNINTDVQTNVQWKVYVTTPAPPHYDYVKNDYVDGKYLISTEMEIKQAEMTVDHWNFADEASTVALTGTTVVSNEYVDYAFFVDNGSPASSLSGTAYSIDYVLANPGAYYSYVYVVGTYKTDGKLSTDSPAKYVYDVNDFTNDIVVKAGIGTGQELYHPFSTLGVSGPIASQQVLPKLVYIDGYYEAKDSGTTYHSFTYAEWQEMMEKQGIVDISADGFDWVDILGPEPDPDDMDPYNNFHNPRHADYDLEKQLKIAEYKSKVKVDVVYGGFPITFRVNGWDGNGVNYWDDPANPPADTTPLQNVKFEDYLDVWQGQFNHNEVGTYTATLLLKKTLPNDLCWSYNDDDGDLIISPSEADRSSVTLVYSISYRTINPHEDAVKKHMPTYNGTAITILEYAWDLEYGDLGGYSYICALEKFDDYVEITGDTTATNAGKYTVYLKIKDEYFNTIHWYKEGNPKGQPGTYKIEWEILPIYVEIPHAKKADLDDPDTIITYNGEGHSVFEILTDGTYTCDSDLGRLLQVTTISGDRGIDATVDKNGKALLNTTPYTATFRLPDSNYAWINHVTLEEGGEPIIIDDNPEQTVQWNIYQKLLDLKDIAWGYIDDDGTEYAADMVDNKAQFQYAVEDGAPKSYELVLIGLPDELDGMVDYITDGEAGSSRSTIGNYFTIVYLDTNVGNNYSLEIPQSFKEKYLATGDGNYEVHWSITERKFNIPADTEVTFDGTAREILELFKDGAGKKIFGDDWDNYLDATVEYKPLDADDGDYVDYYDMASVDGQVDYSMYKAFYLGDYRVTFSIKSELNASGDCVVWMNGSEKEVVDQTAILKIKPLQLEIDGWVADPAPDHAESYVIDSDEYDDLSAEAKELFGYVILDQATGEPVDVEDIADRGAGIYYTIEFVILGDNDYAKEVGMEITCAAGVTNPYEFCTSNYPTSQQGGVTYWLPKPVLTPNPDPDPVYKGVAKEYQISNWSAYEIPSTYAPADVDLTGKTHFVELVNVTCDIEDHAKTVKFDPATGKITVPQAGEYTFYFRFIPDLNLSWFDAPYTYVSGVLLDGTSTPVTATTTPSLDDLTEKHAQTVDIGIAKASVPSITAEQLEIYASMIEDIEYTGYEINLKEREDTKGLFDILKTRYGELIDFEGYKATAAGDYRLIIKLKDPDSSYWNLNITEELIVNDASFAEYDDSYSLMWLQEGGQWKVAYAKPDGKGGYIKYNNGDYTTEVVYKMEKVVDTSGFVLAEGLLDEDGKPETTSGAKYVVDENGIAVKYSLVDGVYVEDAAGTYISKYKLNADGTVMELPVFKDGRQVIDTEKTLVKVVRTVTTTEPYEIEWRITANKLATPTVNENITLTYNGKEQSAESVLKGFSSTYMEIVEGGVGKNANEYRAKIKVKDTDHEWSDPDEIDEDGTAYVYVTWTIGKADVDLSNAQWIFTDGVNSYENGEGMVYTRKNDKAVVYWAELTNIPEALIGSLRYTTNGVVGAYAGRDAGMYRTSFEIFDPNGNFNTITIPETLAQSVTWNIQRRVLEIPSALGSLRIIFDDKPHDLLEMLDIPEDWDQYYTIDVMYAKNLIVYVDYPGHDGKPYEAYGAGGYKFVFDIISGINSNKDNPNVVWLKSNGSIEVPALETDDTVPVEQPVTYTAVKKAAVKPVVEEAVAEEVVEVVENTVSRQVEKTETHTARTVPTAVEVVCDRIKELAYGAELQLNSRKYLR